MTSIVDVHTHFLPDAYRDRLGDTGEVRIADRDGRSFVEHTNGSFPLFAGFRDLEARVEWMDRHGIDATVASVSTPNPNEGPFSPAESTALCRAINDGYGAAQEAYPDRFAGLASLPFREPEAAEAELDRAANDLDLAGVALPTTVRGRPLSDPAYEPVFDRLDELGLPAMVHPKPNALSEPLGDEEWFLTPGVVFPTETTLQLARLVFDGFFDRHEFPLVVAHLGGALPYLVGRLERAREQFRSGDAGSDRSARPARPIGTYLERWYYDAVSFHPPALRAAIETVGEDRLLFGSDYPFGMERVEETLADVETLSLSDEARRAILGETAAELFSISG